MIDWLIIATTAVGILKAFLEKAGSKIAEKSGKEIFDLVKAKLKGDEEGEEILRNFQKKPDRYTSVFADILREKATNDHSFGLALMKLVEKASGQKDSKSFVQIARGKNIAQAAGDNATASVIYGNALDRKIRHKKLK